MGRGMVVVAVLLVCSVLEAEALCSGERLGKPREVQNAFRAYLAAELHLLELKKVMWGDCGWHTEYNDGMLTVESKPLLQFPKESPVLVTRATVTLKADPDELFAALAMDGGIIDPFSQPYTLLEEFPWCRGCTLQVRHTPLSTPGAPNREFVTLSGWDPRRREATSKSMLHPQAPPPAPDSETTRALITFGYDVIPVDDKTCAVHFVNWVDLGIDPVIANAYNTQGYFQSVVERMKAAFPQA